MAANPRRANGHRRDQLVRRVKAEEHHCALCDKPVDQTLHYLDPWAPVVDEDIPVARGGSPYQRSNCHLMHRRCNSWKGTRTIAEARARLAGQAMATPKTVEASPIW